MARYNGQAGMDMRQHLGASHSPHPLHQYGSQVTNNSENLLSPLGHPIPSASIDLSTLNPSFSSNITSEFSSSLFDSNSQNSFGRNVGSATLIPPSQSQSLPPKAISNGGLIPADEWSGTTIAGPGTPITQKAQGLQSPQGKGPSGLAAHQSKQQFVYEGRVAAGSQVLQAVGTNQYQAGLSSSQQSGGSQGGNRDPLQSYTNEVAQGGTPTSPQGLKRGLQGDVQPMAITAVKSEYPDLKRAKTEYTHMEGVKTEHTQALTRAGLLKSSQDSAYQEGSFHGPTSSNQLSGFDVAPTSSQHSGLEGEIKANRGVSHLLSGSYQSGEINSPQSIYNIEQINVPQSSQERGQQGPNRAHSNFQGAQQLSQQNNFQGQQSVQSLRNLGLMQGGNFQGDIQPLDGVSQQSNYAGQSNANHLAHFQRSPSQQSLLQMANVKQLSTYQAQQLQAQAQAQLHAQAQARAQAEAISQAQAEAMSQAHAQAQVANQQAAANQAAIMQARQAQQGSSQQQLLFHSGQQQQFQSGQAQAIQVVNGIPLTGAAQQIIARMQPGMQNQILQGLRLGNRHLIQSPGLGVGNLRGVNLDSGYRSRMPPAIASKCSHTIMLYVQEQRKRPPDNNISFWQKLIRTFFEPGALKRWCLSSYNTSPVGRHAQGLFPMEFWFCNLCGVQPGRGFEMCTDVLPRLFKIKYDSGLLDELLFLDVAEEYILPSGKMVLEYSGAVHESIFAEIRVIRYGTLRVTFSPSFKIQAWEFCTKSHEEVVPCKNLQEQAQQLENLVMEAEQENFSKSVENLTKHCDEFMTTARQLVVKLDAPMVNDLGFSKRYVRCLQISEVVNSMKDLISFERKTRLGPLKSLTEFPSARKLQQQGLLTNHPSQPSLTALINHLTQGASHQSMPHSQLQQGQITRHSVGQAILANGQQGVSQLQGHLLSQLQPGAVAQVHRDPNTSNVVQFSNQLQPQLRGQMDSRNFGLVQPGQAYNTQMQPPGPLHLSGGLQAHSGNPTPSNGISGQLQARMASPGLTQPQAQAPAQAQSGGAGGNQVHLQLNHAQALSQLQGQSTPSQVPSSGLSGGRASPNFNQPSQQTFQSLPKQPTPQPTGQVHSQSHSLNNQTLVNGGQQSRPGTPQSEMSDLRSNA